MSSSWSNCPYPPLMVTLLANTHSRSQQLTLGNHEQKRNWRVKIITAAARSVYSLWFEL